MEQWILRQNEASAFIAQSADAKTRLIDREGGRIIDPADERGASGEALGVHVPSRVTAVAMRSMMRCLISSPCLRAAAPRDAPRTPWERWLGRNAFRAASSSPRRRRERSGTGDARHRAVPECGDGSRQLSHSTSMSRRKSTTSRPLSTHTSKTPDGSLVMMMNPVPRGSIRMRSTTSDRRLAATFPQTPSRYSDEVIGVLPM